MRKRGLPTVRLAPVLLVLVCLAAFRATGSPAAHAGLPPDAPATPTPPGPDRPLDRALRTALTAYVRRVAPGAAFSLGRAHQAGRWAYAVAQQPGQERFVALLAHHQAGVGWRVLAPGLSAPAEYNALLDRFPAELLDESDKAFLRQPEAALTTFSGHRLPWPAGQFAYVTQIDVEPYHVNQVDFDILGLQAAGDVVASRSGTVVFVKESSSEGACDYSARAKGNLVVIQHGPEEYSWYLHLAYQSVPVAVGDWVDRGTRIGVEGDTGSACGVHLHYMASTGHTEWTDPSDPDASPWATGITAVDFYEAAWSDLVTTQAYTSANEPPLLLEVAGCLSLSPALPLAADPVTAEFRLRNAGSQPVSLQQVAVLVRGPGCASWDCPNQGGFPAVEGVALQPGEEYAYQQQRAFFEPGAYLARPAWQDAGGAWHLAGDDPVGFLVGLEPRSYLPLVLGGG